MQVFGKKDPAISLNKADIHQVSARIHDALLTRLSNDDDMEKSLSTFASEMATSAMILGMSQWRFVLV